jgi:DNA-binding transcriptional LysR family regulator
VSLDLILLRILLAVYETKNAGAAAHRLGMSQPGLCSALKRARTALGDPSFLRTARGMEPTARTRALVETIRDILATVDGKIIAPGRFVPAESTSEFCVALSDIGETVYLPPIVRWIAEHAPNATIRSVSLRPRQLEEAMEQGKLIWLSATFLTSKAITFSSRLSAPTHLVALPISSIRSGVVSSR